MTDPHHPLFGREPELLSLAHSRGGIVNLFGGDRDEARRTARARWRLCLGGNAGDLGPDLEGMGLGGSVLGGWEAIILTMPFRPLRSGGADESASLT